VGHAVSSSTLLLMLLLLLQRRHYQDSAQVSTMAIAFVLLVARKCTFGLVQYTDGADVGAGGADVRLDEELLLAPFLVSFW
jgi:hypothetical protein